MPLIDKWLEHLEGERGLAANTLTAYRADVSAMLAYLPDIEVLTPKDVRAWARTEMDRGISRASIQRRLAAFRAFLAWAIKSDAADVNIKDVTAGGKHVARLPRAMTEEQCRAIIDAQAARGDWIGLRNAALYTSLWATGMRISEALSLRMSCPATTGGDTMIVTGKGGRQRMVVILPEMRRAIDAYLVALPFTHLDDDSPLFVSNKGTRLSQTDVATYFATLRDEHGLADDATPHSWRHSFATHMLNADVNLRELQDLLGHKSIRTTQVYTLISVDHILEEYAEAHPRAQAA